MKKVFWAVLLTCLLLAGAAAADSVEDELTAEPWVSFWGTELVFDEAYNATLGSDPYYYSASDNEVRLISIYTYSESVFYLIRGDGFLTLSTEKNGTLKTGFYYRKSEIDAIREKFNKGLKPETAKFGQRIDTGSLLINLKEIRSVNYLTGSENDRTVVFPAATGAPFVFSGTVKNKTGKDVYLDNILLSLEVGGEVIHSDIYSCAVVDGSITQTLPARASCDFHIVTHLNDRQRAALAGATLTISLNDKLEMCPRFLGTGDRVYRWKISADRAKGAEKVQFNRLGFDINAALPAPLTYSLCDFRGSKSVYNDKRVRTHVTYTYEGFVGEEGTVLRSRYIKGLRADGFTVKKSKNGYRVFLKDESLAEIIVEDKVMTINVTPALFYYSESPSLPEATQFAGSIQYTYSTTSKNKKVVSYDYTYLASWEGLKAADMMNAYVAGLKKAGYTVQKSGSTYKVSYQKTLLAVLKVRDGDLVVQVQAGNEKVTSRP